MLGTKQLSMLDTLYPTFNGAINLAVQLVQQVVGGSTPLERSFRALCRHHNVQTNLETMLPQCSAGDGLCLMLSCILQLLAAFAVQLPEQDMPMLPAAEAYGNAAVAYFNAGNFKHAGKVEPAALGEACTAGSDIQNCCACPTYELYPLP